MDKQILQDYIDACALIRETEADIRALRKKRKTMLSEITEGSRRYLILKMRNKYRVGNTLILMECFKGRRTGKIVTVQVTHMTDDSGGLIPGYCVIGFSSFTEAQEEVREDDED